LGQENRPTAWRLLCFPFASLGALAHRNDSRANVPGMSLRGALATLQSRGGVEQRSRVGCAHQSVPRAPARHPRPTPRCHRMPDSRRTIAERHTHQRCGRDSDYHTSLTTSNAASVDGDVGGETAPNVLRKIGTQVARMVMSGAGVRGMVGVAHPTTGLRV